MDAIAHLCPIVTDDVASAAQGDARAFERLYHTYHGRIHRLARRMVSADDADDAVQDIFFHAWTKLRLFRGRSTFSTWLHRLAINMLIRRAARARQREGRDVEIPVEPEWTAHNPSPDTTLDLETALATLPPELRAAIILHDLEGFSHEEVGEMLHISVSAARMRLFRARVALKPFAGPGARP
jgi:RNA polymerase sigma-70 factor (ECF subfamily)